MLNTNDMIARRADETAAAIKFIDEAMEHRVNAQLATNNDDKDFFLEMADWAQSSAEKAHQMANTWSRNI